MLRRPARRSDHRQVGGKRALPGTKQHLHFASTYADIARTDVHVAPMSPDLARMSLSFPCATSRAPFPSPSLHFTNCSIFLRVHWPLHSVKGAPPKPVSFTHGHAIGVPVRLRRRWTQRTAPGWRLQAVDRRYDKERVKSEIRSKSEARNPKPTRSPNHRDAPRPLAHATCHLQLATAFSPERTRRTTQRRRLTAQRTEGSCGAGHHGRRRPA